MRKILLVFILGAAGLGVLALAGLSFIGITPAYIASAPAVATGIGAKLLCSSRYVSGFSKAQSFDDLVQYSGILDQLTITYDEEKTKVTASFFGLSEKSSTFIPGVGCSVDYAGFDIRPELAALVLTPEVSASDSALSYAWPRNDQVTTIDPQIQTLIDAIVSEDNAAGLNTRALLVVKGGKILGEAYAQGADASTPLLGWSMAKSLTAVMLASLEYRGLLDLAAPTSLGEWASDERAQIRMTDLLTMTDGLAFSEEYNPGDDATAMLFDSSSAADYVLAKPAAYQPGTSFNYSSGTANVLARLYENALGGPAEARADYEQNIAAVLGFQHAVFETDAAGGFVGSSYLYASARDWARLGQVMLNEGEINGERLFSADWAAEATKQNTSSNEPAYGYQWWLNAGNKALRWPSLPSDSFAAMGNRQQLVVVIPSEDVVIVRLGWTAGRYPDDANFQRILEAL